MNFNFGEVLSRAWQIIWKNKVLWIFGVFASCSQGGSRFQYRQEQRFGDGGTGPGNLPPQLQQFLEFIAQNATTFIVLAISLVCIFWIIAIFLGTIGRVGLIRGTWQAEGGTEHFIFGQLFSESTPYFWRVFGLSLIPAIPILILIIIFVIGITLLAVSADRAGGAGIAGMVGTMSLALVCICLLIPILWVVGMIFRQAERAIVLEEMPVLPSISRGWDIFKSNLGPIIVMAIILAVIGLVAGFIIAIPVFIVVVPAAIAFMAGNAENWTPMALAAVCICLYIPVSLLLNGIIISYIESAWTLTYMRLTAKPESTDFTAPDNPTPPPPPSLDDGDKTIISSSHV